MNFVDKMIERFIKLNKRMKRWQRTVSVLSAIVVFIVTYSLVLPAVTLDKETASTQAGMEVAASENEPENGGTVYEAEPEEAEEPQEAEEEPAEEPQAEEAVSEDSSSDSESQEAEVSDDNTAGIEDDESESSENEQDDNSGESYTMPVADDSAQNNTSEIAAEDVTTEIAEELIDETAEEVKLITEKTQLKFEYIDENKDDDKDDSYVVYAEFGADAKLPVGVELKVEEITEESNPDAYAAYYEKALNEMQDKYDDNTELSFAKFYDIAFMYEGTEVEPEGNVNVRIEYKKAVEVQTDANVDTIHFDKNNDEKPEVIGSEVDSETMGEEEAVKAVEFESDQFSVYGVIGSGTITTKVITADGETYSISVTYGTDAEIPNGAELEATEIEFDSDAYNNYIELTQDALEKKDGSGVEYARFFDVRILVDGEKIEPKSPVEVKITYEEAFEVGSPEGLKIIHFADEGTELIDVDNDETEITEIVYEQDSFSVIGSISTTNSHGWPSVSDSTGYVLVFKDGDTYYALNHDGTVRKVDYLNNAIVFLGEGTTEKSYVKDYVWNLSTRNTRANILNPDDATRNLDIVYDLINSLEDETLFSGLKRNYFTQSIDGEWYLYTNYYGQYTVTVSGGELHRVPLNDENASPVYFVPYSTMVVTDSESDYLTQKDIDALLDIWQNNMTQKLTVDKTAEVYDYENRMYEVDLFASSGLNMITPDLVLEFVVDASRSMYFPENLYEVDDFGGTAQGLRNWLNTYGNKNQVYYVIDDKDDSARNMAIYYDNGWKATDASQYDAPDGQTGAVYAASDWVDNQTSGKAFKSNMDSTIYIADKKVDGEPWTRLDYMKIAIKAASEVLYAVDPGARIGVVAFNANTTTYGPFTKDQYDNLVSAVESISLAGGTNHQAGLEQALAALNGIENVKNCNTNVVLITDGAPNAKAQNVTWETIAVAANNVKAFTNNFGRATTLFTLGLSLDRVGANKDKLAEIATQEEGKNYSFNAEKAAQVVDCISRIIEGMLSEVNLQGTVTDVIDKAFYPVNSENGLPVADGTWINLAGTVTEEGAEDAAGQITYDSTNKQWKVVWTDQMIDWPTTEDDGTTEHGWHGRVYVKAQEDFLGGNTISTNASGSKAKATAYLKKAIDKEGEIIYVPEAFPAGTGKLEEDFDTPYVNVDELAFTENSTEWTVYKGTEVDPLKEVKELWSKIKVQEIVTDDGYLIYTLTEGDTSNDTRTQIEGLERKELNLTDISDNIKLSDEDWTKLLTGATVYKKYETYGHDVGDIEISLTQTVKEGEDDLTPSPHTTAVTDTEVEKYTLKVVYDPDQVASGTNYHTGSQLTESAGAATNDITSTNNHIINVFAKGIQITKTDETFEKVLKDAKFKLYRTARDGDDQSELVEIDGLTGKYYPAAELDTSSTGVATLDWVEKLQENEKYYLVETEVPEGYVRLADPIEVTLTITEEFVPKPGTETQDTKPTSGIYDWTQKAVLTAAVSSYVKRTDKNNTDDLTHIGIQPDSNTVVLYYRIANGTGMELPHTGGPGTFVYTLCGLTLIAAAALMFGVRMRRR